MKLAAKPSNEAMAATRLAAENADLRQKLNDALKGRVLDEDYEKFVTQALASAAKARQPSWVLPQQSPKRHEVLPVLNFSDWHLDERVNSDEIQGRNGYDRAIAERRLKFCFENVCKVAHTYMPGFRYPGIVVNMLGDNFSGFIHEELRRTNEAPILASLLHWIGPVAAGLQMLAQAFGRVWVTGVVGNHGRYDKKPVAKMRAQENLDWLFMHLVKTVLAQQGETRVSWLIADGQKLRFQLYDMRVITSHGDECKGGTGIAGMLSPQLIAYARMKKNFDFDQWFIGHWHQLGAYRGIRVNGSGKGYDEYASISNFDFQPPLQDFFLVAPRVGITASWPIHCQLPDEPWARKATAAKPFSA